MVLWYWLNHIGAVHKVSLQQVSCSHCSCDVPTLIMQYAAGHKIYS
jgi:hypothetical protein